MSHYYDDTQRKGHPSQQEVTRAFEDADREESADAALRRIRELKAENARLLEAIENAPCPEKKPQGDRSFCEFCGMTAFCWKRKALGNTDGQ